MIFCIQTNSIFFPIIKIYTRTRTRTRTHTYAHAHAHVHIHTHTHTHTHAKLPIISSVTVPINIYKQNTTITQIFRKVMKRIDNEKSRESGRNKEKKMMK